MHLHLCPYTPNGASIYIFLLSELEDYASPWVNSLLSVCGRNILVNVPHFLSLDNSNSSWQNGPHHIPSLHTQGLHLMSYTTKYNL